MKPLRFADTKSGIRERLALLAAVGPNGANDWSYDPRFDRWFRFEYGGQMSRLAVTQEGTASLSLIESRYRISRAAAMALIGYPEEHPANEETT